MRRILPIHRIAALVVVVHLSALPIVAAAHEASHYHFESAIAGAEQIKPCPLGDRGTHRFHFDNFRQSPEDWLCAFCHLLQQTLDNAQAQEPWGKPILVESGRVSGTPPGYFVASAVLSLPNSRSPPSSV